MKNFKKLLSAILAVCILASFATAAFAAENSEDAAISYFTDAGYLKGDEHGNVNAGNAITRAEFAALVNRVAGYSEASESISEYTDVTEGSWYYNDLALALGAGYYEGWNGQMHPNDTITCEQVLTVVARVFGLTADNTSSLSAYSDAENISDWAKAPVAAVTAAGYVETDGALNPTGTITRGKCVTVLYNALTTPEVLYGTASLTYAEFYAGDVSSTDSYDAISSATNSKYSIMSNIYSDFVDADTNADGYHILGVKNVNVAVKASDYAAYRAINPTFALTGSTAPSQYKTVTVSGETASYSATKFNVADTVTNASAVLQTGSTWGDYQINVTDPEGTTYLRNSRADEGFAINSGIQGIILETKSGLRVGMEYLQSIWVQPYEVSFNVTADNTHNTHIAEWDNLPELDKLVGETVTGITYIMQDEAYVYTFDGIYIKPIYNDSISAEFGEGLKTITLGTSDFSKFENGKLTVTYTVGSGRSAQKYTVLNADLVTGTATYNLDLSLIAEAEEGGTYSVSINCDNYADFTVSIPMTSEQVEALNSLIAKGQALLDGGVEDSLLAAHIAEAQELLANEQATSAEAADLISELTTLVAEASK